MPPYLIHPHVFDPVDWIYCAMTTRHAIRPQDSRKELAERLPALAGLDDSTMVVIGEQVHGNKTAIVSGADSDEDAAGSNGEAHYCPECGAEECDHVDVEQMLAELDASDDGTVTEIPGVDGLLTCEKGVLLAVFTADCVPIVLVDKKGHSVAVVHAGREGTLQGIAREAVNHLRDKGWSDPANLIAWIGPSICQEHYEVSDEMAAEFKKTFKKYPKAVNGRLLDLPELNRRQLMEAGLKAKQIEVDGRCTFDEKDLFYSYRRDGDKAGRMATFVMMYEE